jgi:ParB-like chromosome segregation protein Spo0J
VHYREVLIADLKPDPKNARKHGEKNLAAIKASLEQFGQQKPIVCTHDGVVIAGNGTMAAAKALGWTSIQVVYTDLKGKKLKAFALADNKTSELAEWDDTVLDETLKELQAQEFDTASLGFAPFFDNEPEPPKAPKEPKKKECPACGHLL